MECWGKGSATAVAASSRLVAMVCSSRGCDVAGSKNWSTSLGSRRPFSAARRFPIASVVQPKRFMTSDSTTT